MKTILVLAFAIFTFAAAPATTRACDGYVITSYCAPVLVGTREVSRSTECRWAVNSCGNRYSYEVIVITFADYYSDGSCRHYTRTYRS